MTSQAIAKIEVIFIQIAVKFAYGNDKCLSIDNFKCQTNINNPLLTNIDK